MPEVEHNLPIIAYANHHHFLDGHLLWLVARDVVRRPFIVWMEEFDRYPFFAAAGAMPFPADDSRRRFSSIRKAAAALAEVPSPMLAYFPGGVLTRPEEELPPDDPRTFQRLGRIMPPAVWLPLAIHVTWWGESTPTALLSAGSPHTTATGDEMLRLGEALETLRSPTPNVTDTLLEGRRGPNEKWNLSFLRRFYDPC